MLTVKVLCLPLLLLLLTYDGSESVAESLDEISYQSFYPFGSDAHDTIVYMSVDRCSGISYHTPEIFNHRIGVYVSLQIDLLKVNDYCMLVYTVFPVLYILQYNQFMLPCCSLVVFAVYTV